MRRVTLDLGASKEYQPMGTVWLLPPNQSAAVAGALAALGVGPSEKVAVPGEPTVEQWLRLFANLDRPFKNLEWTNRFPSSSSLPGGGTLKEQMEKLDVSTALRHLPANWAATVSLTDICKAMYTIAPREYSIASAPSYGGDGGKGCTTTIDLLVQRHCNGKFSNDFLGSLMATAASGGAVSDTTMTEIACRLRSTSSQLLPFVTGTSPSPSSPDEQQQQQKSASLAPLILLTTGSGMAPVRSLLQHRLSQLATAANDDDGKISLFANFRPGDAALIEESVTDGRTAGLFDVLEMVASNPQKRRAQDAMLAPPAPASASGTGSGYEGDVAALIKHKIEHRNALVFACARPQAVEAFLDTLGRVLSLGEGKAEEVREKLGNRLAVEGYVPAV